MPASHLLYQHSRHGQLPPGARTEPPACSWGLEKAEEGPGEGVSQKWHVLEARQEHFVYEREGTQHLHEKAVCLSPGHLPVCTGASLDLLILARSGHCHALIPLVRPVPGKLPRPSP